MRPYRLKIAESDFEELQRLVFADHPREAGAFLLAGVAEHARGTDVLVRRVIAISPGDFTAQQRYHLEIAPRAINGLASLCEANRIGAVLCHSHPEAIPYSPSDDHGEARIFETLRKFIPSNAPTASLLFYPGGLDGRVWLPDQKRPIRLNEVIVVGRSIRQIRLDQSSDGQPDVQSESYSRQVLAFGAPGQKAIEQTCVAVIGAGGTGSACSEQLARLGVLDLLIMDYDHLDISNVSRVYGSFLKDGNTRWWRSTPLKVKLIERHLLKINPHIRINAVDAHVVEDAAAPLLRDRDVIFLATDDHWGRSVANQVCYQYLIPGINFGVRIDSDEGSIRGATGGIDVLRPGNACLWCKQFLRAERIAAESLPAHLRRARIRERYVEDIDTPAPAVISFNTTVAGMAVSAFLQLVTDFMGEAGAVSGIRYDILEGRSHRGTTEPNAQCICHKVRGFGDLKALPIVDSDTIKRLRRKEKPKP